jgi:ABC-2 type transport system permease protein
MNTLHLYFRYLGVSLRGQMEYRASFLLMAGSHFLVTATEFLSLVVLFDRFGSLREWRLPEVALLYGMINVAFALSEAAARGFDIFAPLIKSGEFDRFLLRPRSTVLQVAGMEFQMMRVGRLLQGLCVLLWAAGALDVAWTVPKVALLVAAVLGGACTFSGLFVLQATLAFWTVESLEIMNAFTYGGTETGQFPMTIYQPWFRAFFTWVIPIACANYFPARAILGGSDPLGSPPLLQWLSPLVGLLFLAVSLQVWRVGVRHYCSTGS